MTALEIMGEFVAHGIRGHVPEATRALATRHLIDTVGAWVAGARTAEGRALRAFAALQAGHETLDVATPCALARLSELDNIHLPSAITPGGIVIPAALSIAAAQPATDGAALLEAVVAGIEAMVRLGAAIGGPTVLYRGIWPTYFAAPFGVAAAASRLYELDAAQAAHALALALTVASPGVGHHNAATTSRWLAIGNAARRGLAAAQAARAGFTSDLKLVDGAFLRGIYGITPDLAAFTLDLGARFALDEASCKPWCAARQTMAATQALIEIMEAGVRPESITAIEVHVPPPYLAMIGHGVTPGDRASHLTSAPYQLAVAACERERLFDVAASPPALSECITVFMRAVTVAGDESLLAHYPQAWPARLVVRTRDGTHERLVLHVPGDPARPFDERQVAQKFRRVVGLDDKQTERLLASCRTVFDNAGSAAALVGEIARAIG